MKTMLPLIIAALVLLVLSPGCTKEIIVKEITRDTVIIREITRDTTIIRSPGTRELLIGKSNTIHYEIETYSSGGVLISKTGFYFEVKADGNYIVVNQDGPFPGKWELATDNIILLDKNTTLERYYSIIYIDAKSYLLRGPFKKNGELKYNYLTNTYYEK
jgi:hypothetical protein